MNPTKLDPLPDLTQDEIENFDWVGLPVEERQKNAKKALVKLSMRLIMAGKLKNIAGIIMVEVGDRAQFQAWDFSPQEATPWSPAIILELTKYLPSATNQELAAILKTNHADILKIDQWYILQSNAKEEAQKRMLLHFLESN